MQPRGVVEISKATKAVRDLFEYRMVGKGYEVRNRLIVKVTLEELVAALKLPKGAQPISVLDCREASVEGTISLVVDHPSFLPVPIPEGAALKSYTLEDLRREFV